MELSVSTKKKKNLNNPKQDNPNFGRFKVLRQTVPAAPLAIISFGIDRMDDTKLE